MGGSTTRRAELEEGRPFTTRFHHEREVEVLSEDLGRRVLNNGGTSAYNDVDI
jgi:hypothetical protein